MNAEDVVRADHLRQYVLEHIPNFVDVHLLGEDEGFHYTEHTDEIMGSGHFLGAPVNQDLDRTQQNIHSPAAHHDPGVVFAYPTRPPAVEEGHFGNCDILRIHFRAAVQAVQAAEHALDANVPPTIMIMTGDIIDFERLGPASDFLDDIDWEDE